MSSRAASSPSFLSPSVLCCHCHWNEVPPHEWPGEGSLGEMSTLPAAGLQACSPCCHLSLGSGAHSVTCQGKSSAGKPSCPACPAEGEWDGAGLHSKVHSSQGKHFNNLKWVVDWSYNWGLVSQCYCNVSADPLQQSAQCPYSLQLFKTIEKQHPMEAISFLF